MTNACLIAGAALALALLPAQAARILLDPTVKGDPAYRFAAGELSDASGLPVVFGTQAQQGDVAIGAGSPAVEALAASGRLSLPAEIKADGFAIRQADGVTVVAGADARGDIYGALWLAERTRLDPGALRSLECVRQPAFPLREFADGYGYREPPGRGLEGYLQECLKLGINTHGVAQLPGLVRLEALGLAEPGTPEWQRIERAREQARAELRLAKAYHMDIYTGTAPFITLPVDDLIARFGDQVSESPGQLCPLRPKTWECHRAHLRELLTAFPEVDFIRITLSDLPGDVRVYDCRGPNCRDLPEEEAIRLACQATWDVVVGEFDKTFIISTWGNPPESYTLNMPRTYRWIMDRLPDRGIIALLDSTQHDFYLISPLNPVMGVGDRPQAIMFQVTREYEGQGFVPVYIGRWLRARLARARETGLACGVEGRLWVGEGLWTRDVLWTHANMYALFRAAWEPDGDPWEWARDWAALTLGPQGAGELADALCLSEEVARRTFWVHGYSGAKAYAYAITHRDVFTDGAHYFRWAAQPHLIAYRENQMQGKVRQALAAAEGALQLRDRMMERWGTARALLRDATLRDACDRDFEHLSALADVLNLYECAMLLWCHWHDEDISTEERCWACRECVNYARRTQAAYQGYRARFDLYRDSGMTAMLDIYLRDCAALSARPGLIAAAPGEATALTLSVFNSAAPDGLSPAVELELPDGWSAEGEQRLQLAYGERKQMAWQVTPPPDAPQGDAEIIARLVASGEELEKAAVRVKVMALCGALAEGGKTSRPTTICPRAAEPPAIDGAIAPGEWADDAPGWIVYPLAQNGSGDDNPCAVEARWMWDDEHFYVAMVVTDDALQPAAGEGVTSGDMEAVTFDFDGDRRDDYEIRFVYLADGLIAWPWTVGGALTSSKIADRERIAALGRPVTLAMGERPDGPGRVIEAAIPWSVLGGFEPEVGRVIGFAFKCLDYDQPGRIRASIFWPQAPPERTGEPTEFADLVFTQHLRGDDG